MRQRCIKLAPMIGRRDEQQPNLRALIGEHQISCEPRTLDRYGRTVALCRVDGRDLGADMVTDGYAWAFVRYSRDYVEEEREAAAVRAGIQ